MNGQARVSLSIKLALLGGAALALAACATGETRGLLATSPIDPASPAAPRVEAVLKQPGDYPTFADIPDVPADLPSPMAFGALVAEQESEGQALVRDTAPATWDLDATDAFAARAKADAGDLTPPTAAEIAESEAFARAARERAKPPPRPQ